MDWCLYNNGLRHERVKKDTLAQVLSCELCEFFKNTSYGTTPNVCLSFIKKKNTPINLLYKMNDEHVQICKTLLSSHL